MTEHSTTEVIDAFLAEPILHRMGLSEAHMTGAVTAANNKLAAGDATAALADYMRLTLIAPNSPLFQLGLAQSATAADMPALGLQAAAAVILAKPDRPDGYFESGRACLAMGEPALALEDFQDALARCEGRTDCADIAKACRAMMIRAEALVAG